MANPKAQSLNVLVRGGYDLQMLRMQIGTRFLANWRAMVLGMAPGQKEEELDDTSKALLAKIRMLSKRPTDMVGVQEQLRLRDEDDIPTALTPEQEEVLNAPELADVEDSEVKPKAKDSIGDLLKKLAIHRFNVITAKRKRMPTREDFKADALISDYTTLCLIKEYVELVRAEAANFRLLDQVLDDYPIWTKWLGQVGGVGRQMGAIIISQFNIFDDEAILSQVDGVVEKVDFAWQRVTIAGVDHEMVRMDNLTVRVGSVVKKGDILVRHRNRYVSSLFMYAGLDVAADGRARSRRKEHLVRRTYVDRAGKLQERDSITYNKFLHDKLLGVLGGSFLRCKGSSYRHCYDEMKTRLESHPTYRDQLDPATGKPNTRLKGQRHRMAIRWMVKMFLKDLYNNWRRIEGLPAYDPYAQAKLGMPPHNHGSDPELGGACVPA